MGCPSAELAAQPIGLYHEFPHNIVLGARTHFWSPNSWLVS